MKFSISKYLEFTDEEVHKELLLENSRMPFQDLVRMSKTVEKQPGVIVRKLLTH